MNDVMAAIELTKVLFQCGVIIGVGLYVLKAYRSYRENSILERATNRILLHKEKRLA